MNNSNTFLNALRQKLQRPFLELQYSEVCERQIMFPDLSEVNYSGQYKNQLSRDHTNYLRMQLLTSLQKRNLESQN